MITPWLTIPALQATRPPVPSTLLLLLAILALAGLVAGVVAALALMSGGRRRVSTLPSPAAGMQRPSSPVGIPDATLMQPGPAAEWQLVATSGQDAGRMYPLGTYAQIGRSADNTIQLNDTLASRAHAVLEWQGNGYTLRDLGSTNGTTLNGIRVVQPVPLRAGDVIQIGSTRLTLATVQPAPNAPSALPHNWATPEAAVQAQSPVTQPSAERGGCLTVRVCLYLVGWFVVWSLIALGLFFFTNEPLALVGVGLGALLSLIFMVHSLSDSWQGRIVDLRVEKEYVPGDEDEPGGWEEQLYAYIQEPGRRKPRKIRAASGWQVGDWLEKRRGETNIRVRRS